VPERLLRARTENKPGLRFSVLTETSAAHRKVHTTATKVDFSEVQTRSGALIVNADDWGRDHLNTDRIFDCFRAGALGSVSAMMFMDDSERAAQIAQDMKVDAGLHLNLTTAFSKPNNSKLGEYQQRLIQYLRGHRLSQVVYNPRLARYFDYVVSAQLDEFRRLHNQEPLRIDGHHHMHLCSNVLISNLLPKGTVARRNFSFCPSEKSLANRCWRKIVDTMLARRHRLTDFFFSLSPLIPARLQAIVSLASESVVELETHPVNPDEYAFLTSGGIAKLSGEIDCSSFARLFSLRH
jgi:predicted glycoside hydrolase/deacetylase ChbG (UPF0249 family)